MRVGNHRPQAVQRVIEVVHASPLARVNTQPKRSLLLRLLGESARVLLFVEPRASLSRLEVVEAVVFIAGLLSATFVRLSCLTGEEIRGRCEGVAARTSSTMASAEAEGGLSVALRQVQQGVVADRFQQVFFADIHFGENK